MKEKNEKIAAYGWIALGLAVLLLKLFFLYYTYWHKHFLVPPGYDASVHYQNIKVLMETGNINFAAYPPGFYFLVILIHKIFRADIWSILTNWTPILIVLPSLAMFFLLRQVFSLRVSVVTISVLLLSSNFPLYAFVDGNYPDMLSYGFFAVLIFAYLIRYFKTKSNHNLIYAGILLLAIALTHHFTFFNILAILIIFVLVQLTIYLVRSRGRKDKNFLAIISLALMTLGLSLFLANFLYGQNFVNVIESLFSGKNVVTNLFLNQTLSYPEYPGLSGGLIWYMGILGFFYLLSANFQNQTQIKTKQLVIVWLLFFFLLSRLSAVGVPGRFARELALPLVVCIGFLFDYILEKLSFKNRIGQILALGLIGYVILMNSALYTNLDQITDPFRRYIWFQEVDQKKVDYLSQNVVQNTPILYNSNANLYFPVKTNNRLEMIKITEPQRAIVTQYLNFPKSERAQSQYQNLLSGVRTEYGSAPYIFSDFKPDADTNETVYFHYKGYGENKKILDDLAANYKVVKVFPDGAVLYKKP